MNSKKYDKMQIKDILAIDNSRSYKKRPINPCEFLKVRNPSSTMASKFMKENKLSPFVGRSRSI